MTDKDIIERWLKGRLADLYEESQCEVPELPKEVIEGKMLALREALSFIDALPSEEEPVHCTKADVDAAMAELAEQCKKFTEEYKKSSDEILAEMRGEEPVSEDLEEACEQLAENARKHKAETSSPFFNQTDYIQGVMDGVKWQKEHGELA